MDMFSLPACRETVWAHQTTAEYSLLRRLPWPVEADAPATQTPRSRGLPFRGLRCADLSLISNAEMTCLSSVMRRHYWVFERYIRTWCYLSRSGDTKIPLLSPHLINRFGPEFDLRNGPRPSVRLLVATRSRK